MAHTHGIEYQRGLGYPPQIMIGTLNWMLQTAAADRIDRLRQAGG